MGRGKKLISAILFAGTVCPAADDQDIRKFELLIEDGAYAEASNQLQDYVAAHPESWKALYQLGYADFRLHRIQDSLAALCKSLLLNQDFAESHKILGYDLNILGRQDLAIHELETAIHCDPRSAESHYELGRICYEQGSYSKAIEHMEASKALEPGNVHVYHNLGLAYSAAGENERAVENFEQALRLNEKQAQPSAWPYIDYATHANRQNRFRQARELLQGAIKIDASLDQAFDELSKANRGLGEMGKAIDALKQAIVLNPRKAEYHYALARLYTQTNRAEEARKELAAYQGQRTIDSNQ